MASFKKLNTKVYPKSGPVLTPDTEYWKKLSVSASPYITSQTHAMCFCLGPDFGEGIRSDRLHRFFSSRALLFFCDVLSEGANLQPDNEARCEELIPVSGKRLWGHFPLRWKVNLCWRRRSQRQAF